MQGCELIINHVEKEKWTAVCVYSQLGRKRPLFIDTEKWKPLSFKINKNKNSGTLTPKKAGFYISLFPLLT